MADDNVDFRFLGQQVKNLQGDVRDLRADQQRLESNVAAMQSDMTKLDTRLDRVEERLDRLEQTVEKHHLANQAQFAQQSQTAATNLKIILTKLSDIEQRLPAVACA